MKILVASDLHLSDRIWRHRLIMGDSYHAWKQIIQIALDHEVDAVILAGDVLDAQANLAEPIRELIAGIRQLQEKKITVYYTQGQHEYQRVPWLAAIPGTVWLHTADLVSPEGWQIVGCDYQNREGLQTFLRSARATSADILVCHQVWAEFMGDVGKPQGAFTDIPENVRVLITGDYHETIIQKYEDLIVISPGSTHFRSVSEPEDKSVVLLSLASRKVAPVIKLIPLATRRRINITVREDSTFGTLKTLIGNGLSAAADYGLANSLPAEVVRPLLWVTFQPEQHNLLSWLQLQFTECAHCFFRQRLNSGAEEPDILQHMDASERVNMLCCLDKVVDSKVSPEVYKLALALLSGPDPEQSLQRWVGEQTCK